MPGSLLQDFLPVVPERSWIAFGHIPELHTPHTLWPPRGCFQGHTVQDQRIEFRRFLWRDRQEQCRYVHPLPELPCQCHNYCAIHGYHGRHAPADHGYYRCPDHYGGSGGHPWLQSPTPVNASRYLCYHRAATNPCLQETVRCAHWMMDSIRIRYCRPDRMRTQKAEPALTVIHRPQSYEDRMIRCLFRVMYQ